MIIAINYNSIRKEYEATNQYTKSDQLKFLVTICVCRWLLLNSSQYFGQENTGDRKTKIVLYCWYNL
jgi:hypothetical protein